MSKRNKLTYPSYFSEMTPDQEKIKEFTKIVLRKNLLKENLEIDRADLLIRMGFMENKIENIPLYIENWAWKWINPYMVYKFFWEQWLPVEMFMDLCEKKYDINPREMWYEWCDFWLDTFLKWDRKAIIKNFIEPYIIL